MFISFLFIASGGSTLLKSFSLFTTLAIVSYHYPEILISGGQLLAMVKMFKSKQSNWGAPFQYHGYSGPSCGVMHAKRFLIALIAGIVRSIGFGNANIVTLYTRDRAAESAHA